MPHSTYDATRLWSIADYRYLGFSLHRILIELDSARSPDVLLPVAIVAAEASLLGEDYLTAAWTSSKVGRILTMLGDKISARQRLTEAIGLSDRAGDLRPKAEALRHLAQVSLDDDNVADFESLERQALSIFESLDYQDGIGHCFMDLGFFSTESTGERITMLRRAIEAFSRTHDDCGCATAWLGIGRIQLEIGVTDAATSFGASVDWGLRGSCWSALTTACRYLSRLQAEDGDRSGAKTTTKIGLEAAGRLGDVNLVNEFRVQLSEL